MTLSCLSRQSEYHTRPARQRHSLLGIPPSKRTAIVRWKVNTEEIVSDEDAGMPWL
jgi:hypothetical protein